MQKIKEELKCPKIEQAISCGRILSFDFSKHEYEIQSVGDIVSFFTRLMIHYLCYLFEEKRVDGIDFAYLKFYELHMEHKNKSFNEWKKA